MSRISGPGGSGQQSSPRAGTDALGQLLEARSDLRTNQDLINHLYRQGGGTWEGATRAAKGLGVDINALSQNRDAALVRPAPSTSLRPVARPTSPASAPATQPATNTFTPSPERPTLAADAPAQVRESSPLTQLLEANPGLRTNQDLINHLYRQGGGTWEGATRAASDLGIDINALSQSRDAALPRGNTAPSTSLRPQPRPQPTPAHTNQSDPNRPMRVTDAAGLARAAADRLATNATRATDAAQSISADLTSGISPDPLSLVGNIKDGTVRLSVPLTEEMIKTNKISLGRGARADINVVVRDGQIDFERTKLDLKNVRALGLVSVEGLSISENGKLRAETLFRPNVTKMLLGADRVPRSIEALSENIHHQMSGPSTGDSPIGMPSNVQIDARGVALRTDRAISLGNGNFFDLKEGTHVNLQGDLNNLTMTGRGGVDRLKLTGGASDIDVTSGQAAFRADMQRHPNGQIDVKLNMERADLRLGQLKHEGTREQIDLQGAALRNGHFQAEASISPEGQLGLKSLDLRGEISAQRADFRNQDAALQARDMRATFHIAEENGQGRSQHINLQDVDAKVDHLQLEGRRGEQVTLQNGSITDAAFGVQSNNSAALRVDVPQFSGTLSGRVTQEEGGRQGEITLDKATASGSLQVGQRGVAAKVSLQELDTSVNNVGISQGGQRLDVAHASLQGQGDINLGPEGLRADASGRLRTTLQDGEVNLGALGRLDLSRGTQADVQLDRAKIGPQGVEDLVASGTLQLGLDDGQISLGPTGSLDIAAGTRADVEVLSSTLGPQLPAGTIEARGRLQGGLDQGTLKLSEDATVDLTGSRFDLDLQHIEKTEADTLPSLRGNMTLETELEVGLSEALQTRLGADAIKDINGRVALDLKDVNINPQGHVNIEGAEVALDASIGSISGKVQLDPQALGLPGTSSPSEASNTPPVAQLASSQALIDQPLSIDPAAIAGRIHNGTVDVELPLQEAGIENATRILGVRTLDVAPDTKVIAKLHVEDGKIDYKKSSVRLSKPVEALGLIDMDLEINDEGKIMVGVLGRDINITSWVLDREQIPRRVSSFVDAASSFQSAQPTSTQPLDIQGTLDQAGEFASLGGLRFEAKGVSLAPGRLQIGDNDYIELDASNRVDLKGSAEAMSVSGQVDANQTYVDLGGSRLDLERGQVRFEAQIKTGLSAAGQLNAPTEMNVELSIPEGRVNELYHERDNGDRFHLQEGEIKDATLRLQHQLQVQNDGSIEMETAPQIDLSVGHFSGRLGSSQVTLHNPDGTPARLQIEGAEATGSLQANDQGVKTTLALSDLDASLQDLDLDVAGQSIVDLDGRLTGGGNLTIDPQTGFALDGAFALTGKVQDARIKMGNDVDLDLSAESQASFALRKLGMGPNGLALDADMSVDAGLDRGMLQVGERQPLRFAQGSNLQMSTTLKHDTLGPSMTLNGRLQAKLAPGQRLGSIQTSVGTLDATLDDASADINLGDVTLRPDGSYQIKDPSIALRLDLGKLSLHQ